MDTAFDGRLTLNDSLWPDMMSLKATRRSPEVSFALLQDEAKITLGQLLNGSACGGLIRDYKKTP